MLLAGRGAQIAPVINLNAAYQKLSTVVPYMCGSFASSILALVENGGKGSQSHRRSPPWHRLRSRLEPLQCVKEEKRLTKIELSLRIFLNNIF
jgi:hypothetical protein